MSIAVPLPVEQRTTRPRLRLPSPRRLGAGALALILLGLASSATATLAYLRLPAPTGTHPVGRVDGLLIDASRTEPAERGGGSRALRVLAWYPAVAGTGSPASYVPGLERIAAGLEASGELAGPVVASLGFVGTSARAGAEVAASAERWPVVVLSPGNATNVAFYGALAEDLASRGYVVLGVDHPFQVAAVDLGDRVAILREPVESRPGEAVAAKIDERVADLTFLLDALPPAADGSDRLGALTEVAGRLDLDRIAVVGHSNGGLAAAAMCADPRVDACANLDGMQAGGPFSARPDPSPPSKPFLFVTKETRLHPALVAVFEATPDAYRIVIPSATHDAFTDGARLRPRLLPVDGAADHVLTLERESVAGFLGRYLRDLPGRPFDGMLAPADVHIEAYPLGGRPTLPEEGRERGT